MLFNRYWTYTGTRAVLFDGGGGWLARTGAWCLVARSPPGEADGFDGADAATASTCARTGTDPSGAARKSLFETGSSAEGGAAVGASGAKACGEGEPPDARVSIVTGLAPRTRRGRPIQAPKAITPMKSLQPVARLTTVRLLVGRRCGLRLARRRASYEGITGAICAPCAVGVEATATRGWQGDSLARQFPRSLRNRPGEAGARVLKALAARRHKNRSRRAAAECACAPPAPPGCAPPRVDFRALRNSPAVA